MADLELRQTHIMQNPDTWSLTGDLGHIRVRAISTTPNRYHDVEVYDNRDSQSGVVGSCAIYWAANGQAEGLDDLKRLIDMIA
jgi:hypothetical protein